MPQNLLDFDLEGLTAWFTELGEKPFRAKQVFHWMHQSGVADFAQMTDIAKSLREKLQQQAVVQAPAINYRAYLNRRHAQVVVRCRGRQWHRDGVHPGRRSRHAVRVVAGGVCAGMHVLLDRAAGL